MKTKNILITGGCGFIGSDEFVKTEIENGYKIRPFQLSKYEDIPNDDVNSPTSNFGMTINPLEIMFIKTNKGINDTYVKKNIQIGY